MHRSELNIARNKFGRFLLIVAILFAAYALVFKFMTQINNPVVKPSSFENIERIKISDSSYKLSNNYLQKNKFGLWELYLEGSSYEMGLAGGKPIEGQRNGAKWA